MRACGTQRGPRQRRGKTTETLFVSSSACMRLVATTALVLRFATKHRPISRLSSQRFPRERGMLSPHTWCTVERPLDGVDDAVTYGQLHARRHYGLSSASRSSSCCSTAGARLAQRSSLGRRNSALLFICIGLNRFGSVGSRRSAL